VKIVLTWFLFCPWLEVGRNTDRGSERRSRTVSWVLINPRVGWAAMGPSRLIGCKPTHLVKWLSWMFATQESLGKKSTKKWQSLVHENGVCYTEVSSLSSLATTFTWFKTCIRPVGTNGWWVLIFILNPVCWSLVYGPWSSVASPMHIQKSHTHVHTYHDTRALVKD